MLLQLFRVIYRRYAATENVRALIIIFVGFLRVKNILLYKLTMEKNF